MRVKTSELIKNINVSGGKIENDYFGDPHLITKLDIKLNKKRIFFLKIQAFFCNLFNIPVEWIDDHRSVKIEDSIII